MQDDPFGHAAGPSFQVVEAQRESIAALIALWGFSDSGKTFSALRLARGLVGAKGKIVVIDTENRRAKFYAGMFGGWHHIDMQPPFTAQRYTAAVEAAIRFGADCIIIDSMSHVWAGEGGVLDQAEASSVNGLAKWRAPKMEYTRMRNMLLRSPVHVIFCLRAKEKFVQTGAGKSAQIASTGHVPICDSLFIYEMTVSAKMESGTHKPIAPVKCPEGMKPSIIPGEFISEQSGAAIAEWAAGGVKLDHAALAVQAEARAKATEGTIKFRDWWQSIDRPKRAACKDIMPEIQSISTQADEESARKAQDLIREANTGDDPLSDPFTQDAA